MSDTIVNFVVTATEITANLVIDQLDLSIGDVAAEMKAPAICDVAENSV